QAGTERARDHGLGGARHAFQQDMAADQEAREHEVDDRILADHGLADLAAHTLSDRADVLNVHRAFPLANDACRGRAGPATPGPAALSRPIPEPAASARRNRPSRRAPRRPA